MAINTYVSIITLNVNGLNAPIKRHRVADWIEIQETHLRAKDTNRLKMRGWKKILQTNSNDKKAGVTILVSDEIDFFFMASVLKKDTI